MPLVWAHAEYAKLVRSLHDGRIFDMPQQPYERYVRARAGCDITLWAAHCRAPTMPVGNRLRIQTQGAAVVRWIAEGSAPVEVSGRDTTVGAWITDLDTVRLPAGAKIQFALQARGESAWSDVHEVRVVS